MCVKPIYILGTAILFFFVAVEFFFYQRKLDFQHSFKDNIKPEVYERRFIQLEQQIDPLNVF